MGLTGLGTGNTYPHRILLALLTAIALVLGSGNATAKDVPVLTVSQQEGGQAAFTRSDMRVHLPAAPCRKHKAHSHRSCDHCIPHIAAAPFTQKRSRDGSKRIKETPAARADHFASSNLNDAARLILARGVLTVSGLSSGSPLMRTQRLRN